MNGKVFYIRDPKSKEYQVVVELMPDWDDFDTLIKYLEVNYKIKILLSADGPGSRRWILEINGVAIEFIHDDFYGNYFLAPTEASEEIINMIGEDLEKRLKDIS